MSKIKKGMLVYVTDGSYSQQPDGESRYGNELKMQRWIVADTNRHLPARNFSFVDDKEKQYNDTIIVGESSGEEVWIQSRFLVPVSWGQAKEENTRNSEYLEFGARCHGMVLVLWLWVMSDPNFYSLPVKITVALLITYFLFWGNSRFTRGYKKLI